MDEAPKMEDFLGGVGGTGATSTAVVDHGELGSIAAGFLHRYPAHDGMPDQNTASAVTVAAATMEVAESDQARRPAETFGQRTSIYRGVTR